VSSSQDRLAPHVRSFQPIRFRPASQFARGFSVIHGEGARCICSVWSRDFLTCSTLGTFGVGVRGQSAEWRGNY